MEELVVLEEVEHGFGLQEFEFINLPLLHPSCSDFREHDPFTQQAYFKLPVDPLVEDDEEEVDEVLVEEDPLVVEELDVVVH